MLENCISKNINTVEDQSYQDIVLRDFRLSCISREASYLIRKEVLTGKAKFGVSGDGKELCQLAIARHFDKGDFMSGYYRDQTIMLALGLGTLENLFAQLYADPLNDPFSGGRQMVNHFATPLVDSEGNWLKHTDLYNISSVVSCTAGQMARAFGLAFASKKYRQNPNLCADGFFSHRGNEVSHCSIGDASTSEGIFWETINAAGVEQIPLVISVWDDGYGISVPIEYQTTKSSISRVLSGFQPDEFGDGVSIYTVKGWDYEAMMEVYGKAVEEARTLHRPALVHVQELTQPQGHSTSGSHERYKKPERLKWEKEYDCLLQMEHWLISQGIATREECNAIKEEARVYARDCKNRAWEAYSKPIKEKKQQLQAIYQKLPGQLEEIAELKQSLQSLVNPFASEIYQNGRKLLYILADKELPAVEELRQWLATQQAEGTINISDRLYSDTPQAALLVPEVKPVYSDQPADKAGYEILNTYFDRSIQARSELFAFGEDVGKIGDVNQGFAGLQAKHGENRVFDTGIREWTIMGMAMGMAMRGMRPIAEVQYLDYLVYGLQPLTDDVATLRWRTNGLQQAPMIVRSRGHRLEGIWHSGSPMGMIINAVRGMYVLTPRNMVQAAGMYQTMLQSNDPAIIIECLNGYRLHEPVPENLGTYTVPIGIPEVLEEGDDVTLLTYGSCVRIAQQALKTLKSLGISVQLVDAQTLIPFDIHHKTVGALRKTNRLVVLDEDVPGGASAYLLQQVLEEQGGYLYLDSKPITITAKAHRAAYGSDGDYFSKPNAEDVVEAIYRLCQEAAPEKYPKII